VRARLALALSLSLAVVASAHAQKQQDKVADAKIVTKTHDAYTAVFQADEDGTLDTISISDTEYAALAEANSGPLKTSGLPGNKTWVFISASQNDVYDTPSGKWEAGNIYVQGDGAVLVILPDEIPLALDPTVYTISENSEKGVSIVPDPPGHAVKDGAVLKDAEAIDVPAGVEVVQ